MKWQQNTSPSGHLLFQSKNFFFSEWNVQDSALAKPLNVRMVCVCVCVWSSIQAVDVEAVAVTVKELVSYALTLNPNNQSWLITQADIYFGKKMSEKTRFFGGGL